MSNSFESYIQFDQLVYLFQVLFSWKNMRHHVLSWR